MATFRNVVQSTSFDYNQSDHDLKGKWASAFFSNHNPVILELGCGKGEYTVSLAIHYPDKNFIGVDIKGARMWKGAKDALSKNISNVGFLRTNIAIIDKFFAKGEVNQIWLTFPDPQMKNVRRRLTATNFMEKYREILAPSGTIHLKTDSNFQYRYTLEMVRENNLKILACTDNLYNSEFINEELSIQTFYEKQWRERGIDIKYLAFQLNHERFEKREQRANEVWTLPGRDKTTIEDEPLREPTVEIERDPYRSFGRSARE